MLVFLMGKNQYELDYILSEMARRYSTEYDRDLKSYFEEKKILLREGIISAFGYIRDNRVIGYIEYEKVSDDKVSFTMLYGVKGFNRSKDLCQFLNQSMENLKNKEITSFVCHIPHISSIPLTKTLKKSCFTRYKRLEMELEFNKISIGNAKSDINTECFCLRKVNELTEVMIDSFAGSVDSKLYSEFFTPIGQRKVLYDIVDGKYGKFLPNESLFLINNNDLIGYGLITAKDKGTCFLMDFAIKPSEQGQGLSKKLLLQMIYLLINKGYQRMRLAVTMENKRALNLYKNLGFKKIGTFDIYLN